MLSVSIDLTKINKEKLKDNKYLNITVGVEDETNDYNQNTSAWHEQSKEERDNKQPREYLGNGRVFWTDGIVKKVEWKERITNSTQNIDREEIDLF